MPPPPQVYEERVSVDLNLFRVAAAVEWTIEPPTSVVVFAQTGSYWSISGLPFSSSFTVRASARLGGTNGTAWVSFKVLSNFLDGNTRICQLSRVSG